MELTLTVVGIDFPNADGSNRRSEAMMTLPSAPKSVHKKNTELAKSAIAEATSRE